MHSRGDFESMHSQPPVPNIVAEVSHVLRTAIDEAKSFGVAGECIALDVGIGFGKTPEQNLELIARLDKLTAEFSEHPIVVGTSRKSFLGKILDNAPVDKRLSGSLGTAAIAIWNGAAIVRVHDVRETVELINIVTAVREQL